MWPCIMSPVLTMPRENRRDGKQWRAEKERRTDKDKMGHDSRKLVSGVTDQERHKLAYAVTEKG